ncbi:hypothetical protein Tco_0949972 [Tanacetum coccineum]
MFQQHHGESLSEAWTRFKDLLQKVSHHGSIIWLQVQIFYDHVNPVIRRTIDQSAGRKLRDRNAEESCALSEYLALYNNECSNGPMDFAKSVKTISLPQDVPSTSDCRLIELENQSSLAEQNRNPSSPKRVHFVNSIIILNTEDEAKEEGSVKSSVTENKDHKMTVESEEEFKEETEKETREQTRE